MKAITLWQPWASLVTIGAKTLETRSWATSYRGPLAIHAAARTPQTADAWTVQPDALGTLVCHLAEPWTEDQQVAAGYPPDGNLHGFPLPLGAVVATCTLADVVPMVAECEGWGTGAHLVTRNDGLELHHAFEHTDVEHQRPYGDFAPGRWAWLLEDVQALPEPVPARGRQQLWNWDAA